MKLPPPIKTFLHRYDLSGKTVISFNTNGGYGGGSSFRTVKELCTDGKILEGFVTRDGVERNGEYLIGYSGAKWLFVYFGGKRKENESGTLF